MSPPMSLSCSRAAVHAGRPTDYVTSGRRPQLLRSIQHLRSCPIHSWTPPRCPLPIAHVRSIPPHREGGPHRMATLVGCGMRARSSSRVHIGGHLGTTATTWPTGAYGGEQMAFAGSWEPQRVHERTVLRASCFVLRVSLAERRPGYVVKTLSMLTTEANNTASALHHRMPVTLSPEPSAPGSRESMSGSDWRRRTCP